MPKYRNRTAMGQELPCSGFRDTSIHPRFPITQRVLFQEPLVLHGEPLCHRVQVVPVQPPLWPLALAHGRPRKGFLARFEKSEPRLGLGSWRGYHDDAATQALRKLGVCDVIEERIREPSAS